MFKSWKTAAVVSLACSGTLFHITPATALAGGRTGNTSSSSSNSQSFNGNQSRVVTGTTNNGGGTSHVPNGFTGNNMNINRSVGTGSVKPSGGTSTNAPSNINANTARNIDTSNLKRNINAQSGQTNTHHNTTVNHNTLNHNLGLKQLTLPQNQTHSKTQINSTQLANASDRLKHGHLDHLVTTDTGKHLDLKKQFDLHAKGDVARQMDLHKQLNDHGGWDKRLHSQLGTDFHKHVTGHPYCGPHLYSQFCMFPHWSPWVNWCWNFHCLPWWDPRPICCRPIFYLPCQPWVVWQYPVWYSLPTCYCGTWVDVPVVSVANGNDLQLLAVRFVDAGHPEQGYGPRYRVWFRNNSAAGVTQPFDILAYASNSELPAAGQPEAGVRVSGMTAGQVQSVDLRLPATANSLALNAEGQKVPFQFLHVIVDSGREIPEADEANNGAVLNRTQILPVDPAVFTAALESSSNGATINLAGEGFGPEPGQVIVSVHGVERPAEIQGWYDLGVQIRVPSLNAADALQSEVVIVRGDKAASNPAPVKLPVTAVPAAQSTVTTVVNP